MLCEVQFEPLLTNFLCYFRYLDYNSIHEVNKDNLEHLKKLEVLYVYQLVPIYFLPLDRFIIIRFLAFEMRLLQTCQN